MPKWLQWIIYRSNPFNRTYTVRFYMKSGNVITAPRVKEYTFKDRSGALTSYSIVWDPMYSTMSRPVSLVVDIDQVEAVSVHIE